MLRVLLQITASTLLVLVLASCGAPATVTQAPAAVSQVPALGCTEVHVSDPDYPICEGSEVRPTSVPTSTVSSPIVLLPTVPPLLDAAGQCVELSPDDPAYPRCAGAVPRVTPTREPTRARPIMTEPYTVTVQAVSSGEGKVNVGLEIVGITNGTTRNDSAHPVWERSMTWHEERSIVFWIEAAEASAGTVRCRVLVNGKRAVRIVVEEGSRARCAGLVP